MHAWQIHSIARTCFFCSNPQHTYSRTYWILETETHPTSRQCIQCSMYILGPWLPSHFSTAIHCLVNLCNKYILILFNMDMIGLCRTSNTTLVPLNDSQRLLSKMSHFGVVLKLLLAQCCGPFSQSHSCEASSSTLIVSISCQNLSIEYALLQT